MQGGGDSQSLFKRTNDLHNKTAESAAKSVLSVRKLPNGAGRNLSKSIIVHHNRKTNIIQSFGRYNDVMSHENFEQDYEAREGVAGDGNDSKETVQDLYQLDDSFSVKPQRMTKADQ